MAVGDGNILLGSRRSSTSANAVVINAFGATSRDVCLVGGGHNASKPERATCSFPSVRFALPFKNQKITGSLHSLVAALKFESLVEL